MLSDVRPMRDPRFIVSSSKESSYWTFFPKINKYKQNQQIWSNRKRILCQFHFLSLLKFFLLLKVQSSSFTNWSKWILVLVSKGYETEYMLYEVVKNFPSSLWVTLWDAKKYNGGCVKLVGSNRVYRQNPKTYFYYGRSIIIMSTTNRHPIY